MGVGRSVAIITLTKNGTDLGKRLGCVISNSHLFAPSRFADGIPNVRAFDNSVSKVIGEAFTRHDGLILILSLGIAVRALDGRMRDKHRDPAVVVLDEEGKFAISVLSGHVGGANELARNVAQLIGATPVITTASDVQDTIAVDLLGQELGWEIDGQENVTRVSAAIVNDEVVGLFQDAGEPDWWPRAKPLPTNIQLFESIESLGREDIAGGLIVTDRLLGKGFHRLLASSVVYRPKSLVVGLGCNRGTSSEEIESAVRTVLERNLLSFKSVRNLATVDVKSDEQGLLGFAEKVKLPIEFYAVAQLREVNGIPSPSDNVRRAVGSYGVCEPAALLSSGVDGLVVAKTKMGNVTVAVARAAVKGSHR